MEVPLEKNVGLDMVDISRFVGFRENAKHLFIINTYSAREIEYCFSFKDPAPHLAGVFAAKEAVSKALGVYEYPVPYIEIKHDAKGRPEPWYKDHKLNVAISITHTDTVAAAIAVIY